MFEITAGLLLRKQLRNFLERLKFQGHNIEYFETKGFLESEFLIKCDDHIKERLENIIEEING